ncbi:MAG TPA: glycoside hydrolase family 130 protein [Ilumatobacter sp.]|nr:glycoside hydrolase family 130 protein [Ilumatobacter sp.]
MSRCESVHLLPDPRRVITKPFLPREEILPDGSSRMRIVLERILAMPEHTVADTLGTTIAAFDGRHRDLDAVLARNFDVVVHRLGHADLLGQPMSDERRNLIGAYFTHEYSIEAAALGNPSIVAGPDQSGLGDREVRVVISLRAIGEGHVSSVEFRSGVLGPDAAMRLDPPGRYTTTGTTTPAADTPGSRPPDYHVRFPATVDISERVLFPSDPTESHGMEDARFVRFVDDDGRVVYYATYTAFDGRQIRSRLLETDDFVDFRVTTLAGAAAGNKGIALFPRRIDGRFMALGRHDNVNNYVMVTDDVHEWHRATVIQEPELPWELMQLGNCGPPIETEAGWLVITHGVGPMRQYTLGAVLLDHDDPTRVLGHLKQPLLAAAPDEREGYVPNVVYSCGAMTHDGQLVVPYGFADVGAHLATTPLPDLLDRLQ